MKLNQVKEVFGVGLTPPAPQEPRQSPEPAIFKALSNALNMLKQVQNTPEGREVYQAIYKMTQQYSPNAAKKSAMNAQNQRSQFAQDTKSQRWS